MENTSSVYNISKDIYSVIIIKKTRENAKTQLLYEKKMGSVHL